MDEESSKITGKAGDGSLVANNACVVTGNMIDSAEGFGIVAATNNAALDLNINANLILNATVSIGFSNNGAAGQIAITGNQIKSASGGSIVAVGLDGADHYARVGGADYGNQTTAQIANAFIGGNRSY